MEEEQKIEPKDGSEDMVPKEVLKTRTEILKRIHRKELRELEKSFLAKSVPAQNPVADPPPISNEELPMHTQDPAQQPVAAPNSQPNAPMGVAPPDMTPPSDMTDGQKMAAQQAATPPQAPQAPPLNALPPEIQQAVLEQAKAQLVSEQKQANIEKVQADVNNEMHRTIQQVLDAEKNDADFAKLTAEFAKSHDPNVLIGAIRYNLGDDDAPAVIKKLLENPEYINDYLSQEQPGGYVDVVGRTKLMNNIKKQVAIESRDNIASSDKGAFANAKSTGGQKAIEDMDKKEYMDYMKKTGRY